MSYPTYDFTLKRLQGQQKVWSEHNFGDFGNGSGPSASGRSK